jgi:hypothetical protein
MNHDRPRSLDPDAGSATMRPIQANAKVRADVNLFLADRYKAGALSVRGEDIEVKFVSLRICHAAPLKSLEFSGFARL